MNSMKPGSAGSDTVKLAVERPKLNLKPRSQPLEQLEGNVERERYYFFISLPMIFLRYTLLISALFTKRVNAMT